MRKHTRIFAAIMTLIVHFCNVINNIDTHETK